MGVANIGAAATAMLILGGRYVGHLARTARNGEVVIHQARPIEWDHAYHRDLGKTKHEETRVQFQHQMSSDFVVMSTVKSSGFGSVLRLRVCSAYKRIGQNVQSKNTRELWFRHNSTRPIRSRAQD